MQHRILLLYAAFRTHTQPKTNKKMKNDYRHTRPHAHTILHIHVDLCACEQTPIQNNISEKKDTKSIIYLY